MQKNYYCIYLLLCLCIYILFQQGEFWAETCKVRNIVLLGPGFGSEAAQYNVVTTLSDSGDVLQMVKSVIPPLQRNKHKGQDGRLATIGGCKEYTGAPYFAALAALKTVSG